MKNKKIPAPRVKTPQKGDGEDWIRQPVIHGDPNPEGTQKLTHGSANLPSRGPGAPAGNRHSSGNIPLEYFEGFGWTTTAKIAQWFDKAYDKYKEKNRLKIAAFNCFHPVDNYELRSPTYQVFDL